MTLNTTFEFIISSAEDEQQGEHAVSLPDFIAIQNKPTRNHHELDADDEGPNPVDADDSTASSFSDDESENSASVCSEYSYHIDLNITEFVVTTSSMRNRGQPAVTDDDDDIRSIDDATMDREQACSSNDSMRLTRRRLPNSCIADFEGCGNSQRSFGNSAFDDDAWFSLGPDFMIPLAPPATSKKETTSQC